MNRRIHQYSIFVFLFLNYMGCREPFEIESIDFQNSLVVEATLTNEFKQQTLKLSRTYELNQEEPVYENGALVQIEDSDGNMFTFLPVGEGVYQSEIEFEAVPDTDYQLLITTSEGERFQSTALALTPISEITNLYGELLTNTNGDEGIQIFVDSDNQTSEARYFRYEYEETYQVIAPFWFPYKPILTDFFVVPNPEPFGDFEVEYNTEYVLRPDEERICYSTKKQQGILLTTTNSLTDNMVKRFPIRFINKNDGIIKDRYSIKVKQYVQSLESYTYYRTLKDLGDIGSILSQSQPGFVVGNITSMENSEQQVIGYFEVTSVSEKRIFFNYFDFNLLPPDYLYECEIIELDYNDNEIDPDMDRNDRYEIYRLITLFPEHNQGYELVEIPMPDPNGIWKLVNPECGDCTSVSSNIRPDFWED